ncbi:MAG: AbrB/MazE/SpoVT family DNA-binding domain-containing protein [Patescibacteria group bacterium]
MRRKLENKSVRKIFKSGSSYAVTLPIEAVNELKWKEKQRVVIKKHGQGIIIKDWKK